jgi:homoserine dehydrogenase
MKIGLVGLGTVGRSVVEILKENRDIIAARAGKEIVPIIGAARELESKKVLGIELTNDIDAVLESDVDVVVELMGGVDKPYEIVKKALANGKSVVTANKALLAYHRYELQEKAGDLGFGFEASVAGGIPIIKALREGLSANHIDSIAGIMNGTCNYILTKMMHEGVDFESTLKEAQELGYAEADPTFDVGGFDAAHKLLILASIAYGIDAKPEEILIEGIDGITGEDIAFAKEFGYSIKLLTIAKKVGEKVELRVHPALIKNEQMIAKVDGVMNAVSVYGDKVGETMYYGPGAGGDATASAVVADLIDIARSGNNTQSSPMLGFTKPLENNLTLAPYGDIETKYYIRMRVADKTGVLAQVAKILGDKGISIEAFLQSPHNKKENQTSILLSTHTCLEKRVMEAFDEIENLDICFERPSMIRIES